MEVPAAPATHATHLWHIGQSIATVGPSSLCLVPPALLPWLDSVLVNVIKSLAPAEGLPTRRGHGACLSSGRNVVAVALRRVQTGCPLKQWCVHLGRG